MPDLTCTPYPPQGTLKNPLKFNYNDKTEANHMRLVKRELFLLNILAIRCIHVDI